MNNNKVRHNINGVITCGSSNHSKPTGIYMVKHLGQKVGWRSKDTVIISFSKKHVALIHLGNVSTRYQTNAVHLLIINICNPFAH